VAAENRCLATALPPEIYRSDEYWKGSEVVGLYGPRADAARKGVAVMKAKCGDTFTVVSIEDVRLTQVMNGQSYSTLAPHVTFECGGPGAAAPLTARVLGWASSAQDEAARDMKNPEAPDVKNPSRCTQSWDCVAGGTCFDGVCRM